MNLSIPVPSLGLIVALSLFQPLAMAVDHPAYPIIDTRARPDRSAGDRDLKQFQTRQLALYRERIAARESLYNTYDPVIGESLTGLGKIQEKLGQYGEALDSYRRAMHIERVNNGIYSLSQEPMLRGMVSIHETLEDFDSAAQAYDRLQNLYVRNYGEDSPKLISLLKEKSDWHINAYARNPDRGSLHHLGNAYRLMVRALNLASAETPAGQVTVLPLWHSLAVANFLLADYGRRHPVGERQGFSFATTSADTVQADPLSQDEVLVLNSYRGGRQALEQIVVHRFDDPGSSARQRAAALADLGDWHLLFGRYHSASEIYREAWKVAANDDTLKTLFDRPVIIPPGGRASGQESAGPASPGDNPAVVARLAVDNRGRPRDIEIVETLPEENESLSSVGYQILKSARFRPRLQEGEMVASGEFTYRLEVTP